MNWTLITLVVLCIALAGHFFSQKMLMKRGSESEDRKPFIKRLVMNGIMLAVVAVLALIIAERTYKPFGILMLVEAGVCIFFAFKLKKQG